MVEYGTFAKFYSAAEAQPLLELLRQESIPFRISQERYQLDAVIIGSNLDPMIIVTIPVDEFAKVNEMLREHDFKVTKSVNEENNVTGERLSLQWIVFGYILSLFVFAGILGGLAILGAFKRLPDGRKVALYDALTRAHAKAMIGIGIIATVWWLSRNVLQMNG